MGSQQEPVEQQLEQSLMWSRQESLAWPQELALHAGSQQGLHRPVV